MSELLEKILSKDNMNTGIQESLRKQRCRRVDGVTVEELGDYIKENWGQYQKSNQEQGVQTTTCQESGNPQAERWVRKLGIPTVMDRVIQQGIVQVISPMCEPLFSENRYTL